MKQVAEVLITNQLGGPLAEMKVSAENPPEFSLFGSIVIHTVAVLSADSTNPLLIPLVNMLTNPAALIVSNYCL